MGESASIREEETLTGAGMFRDQSALFRGSREVLVDNPAALYGFPA